MKAKKVLFVIFTALVFALMLVVLELNKNTLLGFILAAALCAGFCVLHRLIVKKRDKWFLRLASWVGWIALFSGVLMLTYPPVQSVPATEKSGGATEVVTVAQGKLRGVYNGDKSVEVFAGIPFAKPPVGELRWREPQDPEPWEGVLNADTFAPMSMQPQDSPVIDSLTHIIGYHDYELTLADNCTRPASEDSLYLNIWKPSGKAEGLPVLVYFHGGSLKTGQPWFADYNGEPLAEKGVVVVNAGYRLGIFGFFASEELAAESENGTTGNYGLLDQIKALEWVRDNIKAFGGDPSNVTVAGESAGAACVSALCTSPLAKGLFERAVLESSTMASVTPPHSFRLLSEAEDAGKETLERFGCRTVEELRSVPAQELVGEAENHHHITIDGYALTETPYISYMKGIHNEKAILHGYNSEESGPFIVFDRADLNNYEEKVRTYFGSYADAILKLYPAETDEEADRNWAKVFGAVYFDYPHYCLNRFAVQNKIPVYEYVFSKDNGRLGAWHSGEIVYFYGNIPDGSALYAERDRELSAQMLGYLSSYAHNGDPNSEGLPEWKQNTGSDSVMSFGDSTEMIPEREHELFAILDLMETWGR